MVESLLPFARPALYAYALWRGRDYADISQGAPRRVPRFQ